MKKIVFTVITLFLLSAGVALAGGDQNQNRHDGEKGLGPTTQHRTNK